MPYKNKDRQSLFTRGTTRTSKHDNWRQTYIDCAGMCVGQRIPGVPCGETEGLELHEEWGEGLGKFQRRMLLCNDCHALVEDRVHQFELIKAQYQPSVLQRDVQLEVLLAGSYLKWVKKHKLDDSRFGAMLFSGPEVEGYEEM